jgi:hypothetical protein
MTTSFQPFGYSTDAGKSPRRKQRVPESLIRETINGVPFYYKGYQQVLRKHKTPEEIMAVSGLQALLKKNLYDLQLRQLDSDGYEVFVGEDWLLVDWHKDIELWKGIKASIGTFLAQKGIQTP